jgi:hypothetical protein
LQASSHVPHAAGPVLLQVAMSTQDDEVKLTAIYWLDRVQYAPSKQFLRDQRTFLRTQAEVFGYVDTKIMSIAVLGSIRDPADVDLLLSLMDREVVWHFASRALEQMPLTDTQRRRLEALRAARP